MSETTAVANRPAPTLRDFLVAARPKLGEVCARHLPADRLVRLAVAAISRTPKLAECTPQSVLASVFVAGRLGLEPDGVLGGAYLVPFGRECQLIIGYRGLVDLAIRSGKVRSVVSRVVHAKDKFRVTLGLDDSIKHVPTDDEDPGLWTHVYAVATLADGTRQFEVMSRRQVLAIREKSRAKNNGPWANIEAEDGKEMARKTVVKRLAKSLPLSTEFAAALALDTAADTGTGATTSQVAEELALALPEPGPVVEGRTTVSAPAEESPAPALQAPPARRETVEEAKARVKAEAAAAAQAKGATS